MVRCATVTYPGLHLFLSEQFSCCCFGLILFFVVISRSVFPVCFCNSCYPLGFCFSQETFFLAWAFVIPKRHFLDFRFTPRKRLRKNPVLFHVATLSSAHRKSRPKLKLGPDVLHSVVIEVIGLACHATTSLICIDVSNPSPHETIRPKNSTLSDLARFLSVDSSGSGAFFFFYCWSAIILLDVSLRYSLFFFVFVFQLQTPSRHFLHRWWVALYFFLSFKAPKRRNDVLG